MDGTPPVAVSRSAILYKAVGTGAVRGGRPCPTGRYSIYSHNGVIPRWRRSSDQILTSAYCAPLLEMCSLFLPSRCHTRVKQALVVILV